MSHTLTSGELLLRQHRATRPPLFPSQYMDNIIKVEEMIKTLQQMIDSNVETTNKLKNDLQNDVSKKLHDQTNDVDTKINEFKKYIDAKYNDIAKLVSNLSQQKQSTNTDSQNFEKLMQKLLERPTITKTNLSFEDEYNEFIREQKEKYEFKQSILNEVKELIKNK